MKKGAKEILIFIAKILKRIFVVLARVITGNDFDPLPPRWSKAEVEKMARAIADAEDWPWIDPYQIDFCPHHRRHKPGEWHIITNYPGFGGNIFLVIEDETGRILQKGFAPR